MSATVRLDAFARSGARGYPIRLERRYRRFLEAQLDAVDEYLAREFRPVFESMRFLEVPDVRADNAVQATAARLLRIIATAREAVLRVAVPTGTLAEIATELDGFVTRRVYRELRAVAAIGSTTTERTLHVAWAGDNARLITSIPARYLDDVARVVRDHVDRGAPTLELERAIRGRYGVAKSRARLIARDQIGKLQAQITESRQVALGVTEYTWTTAGDERVREEHEDRDGQVFKWSDPPSDGHPGQPIACRCVAIALPPR